MPVITVFKIVGLVHQSLTGKQVLTHRERYINNHLLDRLEELSKNE